MNKALKIIVLSVTLIVILVIGGVLYVSLALPNVCPAPKDLKVNASPEK